MRIIDTPIDGLFEIELNPHSDSRGEFMRTYCKDELKHIGFNNEIVQINQSISKLKGTFRGFHYQLPPFSEIKIVRCLSGAVNDIVIDLRKGSPTFLNSFYIELSESNNKMLLVPSGLAHGFQTMADDTKLLYLHTEFYNPDFETGIRYDDPLIDVKITLPISQISERDQGFNFLDINFKGI